MEYASYLTTMAQVAGVMVGFANLANAISRPDMSNSELKVNKLRIIITTELGIVLICLCVLPLMLAGSELSNPEIFRITSLVGLIANLVYAFYTPIRAKRWTGKSLPTSLSKIYHLGNILLITIPITLSLFGVFGDDKIGLIYCYVTFCLFVFLATLFCRLLYSVLPTTEG
jgi:hypothetical protein